MNDRVPSSAVAAMQSVPVPAHVYKLRSAVVTLQEIVHCPLDTSTLSSCLSPDPPPTHTQRESYKKGRKVSSSVAFMAHVGPGLPFFGRRGVLNLARHMVGLLWKSDQLVAKASTET
jgi:hypothetical protein